MPADEESAPWTQTRREYIALTCPSIGLGVLGSGELVHDEYDVASAPRPRTTQHDELDSVSEAFYNFPDDPFIVPVGNRWFSHRADLIGSWVSDEDRPYFLGYEPTTLGQKIRAVVGLHLDALDSQGLDSFEEGHLITNDPVVDVASFGRQIGIPTAVGWNYTVNLDGPLQRYGPILEAEGWEYPDGTPLDSPRGLLLKNFDGEIRTIFETRGVASAFAPGTRDLLVRATEQRIRQGYAGFFADGGPGIFIKGGLDFSVWATAAFQEHLSSLSEDRLNELGVDNPNTFDIKSHLRAENLAPDPDEDPRGDPIFREYLLNQHRGIKAFCQAYRDALEQSFPERMAAGEIKLWTNHYMGNFEPPQTPNVYVSDSFDIIHTEIAPTVRPGVDFVYKLLRALGRFSKPVMAKGTLDQYHGPRKDAFDTTRQYRMFQRFLMAEAAAHGAIMKPALTVNVPTDEAVTNWVQTDGTIPDELRSFIDFLWAHRRFLEPIETEADVRCAVVWSLPTRIWRYAPRWGIGRPGDTPLLDSFVGTTRLLREVQIPYEVIVFGHSLLWDDADQLERLMGYDAVILPGVECLSEEQSATIQEYLDTGGAVITSGQPPDRDEMYVPDDELAGVFGREGVTVLVEDPGYKRANDGRSDGSLIDALADVGLEPVTVEPESTLAVNRLTQPAEGRTVVHLLNYDYSPATDEFAAKEGIDLQLSAPEHEVVVARYYTPQGAVDLDFTNDANQIELTVPKLVEWGFVVLASSAADLVEAASESNARELVEEGNRLVADARDTDRDWGPGFALATTKLDAATTALDYEAYGQAETAATEAIEAITETYPRPVIGVDWSHNQSTWEPPTWLGIDEDAPFWWLEDNFEDYRFEVLDGWDRAALDSIDVLLVPPTLEGHGSSFGFEADELDRLEEFVSNGGSVVIVGDGRAASDIDELTDRFGYEFLGPRIEFPEGEWGMAPTTTSHPLTRRIDAISVANGTPIGRLPESAAVLASIPEDSQAWLSTEPPQDERREDEESAAGAAVLAHGRHDDGHVVVLGSPNFAFAPMHADPAMELLHNLFTYLGRESVRKREDGDPTSPTTDPTTASDGQPGFSMLVGVGGILAGLVGYVWQSRRADDDS